MSEVLPTPGSPTNRIRTILLFVLHVTIVKSLLVFFSLILSHVHTLPLFALFYLSLMHYLALLFGEIDFLLFIQFAAFCCCCDKIHATSEFNETTTTTATALKYYRLIWYSLVEWSMQIEMYDNFKCEEGENNSSYVDFKTSLYNQFKRICLKKFFHSLQSKQPYLFTQHTKKNRRINRWSEGTNTL